MGHLQLTPVTVGHSLSYSTYEQRYRSSWSRWSLKPPVKSQASGQNGMIKQWDAVDEDENSVDLVHSEVRAGGPYQPISTYSHTQQLSRLEAQAFTQHHKYCCCCVNTSFMESFHSMLLKYCPKRRHHFSKTYTVPVYVWLR